MQHVYEAFKIHFLLINITHSETAPTEVLKWLILLIEKPRFSHAGGVL